MAGRLRPRCGWCDSTRLKRLKRGPERHAADVREAGIDAVNLHHTDWTGGLTTLFHRFGVLAFGWDAQHDRVLDELLDMGIDAVYSDHIDRMVRRPRAGEPEPAGATASRAREGPEAEEGAADDRVLVDGAEAAAVGRVGAVVAHHEHVVLRAP